MALSSLTSVVQTGFRWNAQNNLTGSVYNPIQNPGNITKQLSLGTAVGNTTTGGADELFSFQQGITAGSSATISLAAMTNILSQTSVSIVRIKALQVRLLSAADDPTISPAPTSTSTITLTNFGPVVPNALDFATGGSGLNVALTCNATTGAVTSAAIAVAGTGYLKSAIFNVSPQQATGCGAVVAVTTNSTGIPTSVALVSGGGGTNYTNANVATCVLGQYTILTGGAHMYFDPAANGFVAVSSTASGIKVINNDGSNAVTFELDIIGCTS